VIPFTDTTLMHDLRHPAADAGTKTVLLDTYRNPCLTPSNPL